MRPGKITVVAGPMFSEKSLRAISNIQRAINGGKIVQVFRPNVPGRDTLPDEETNIVSRFGVSYPATIITDYDSFFTKLLNPKADKIVIDEAQFCEPKIVDIVRQLRRMGKDVDIFGLDLDVFEQPFGPMPQLMALAQEVIKVTAVCMLCHDEAQISFRLAGGKEQILIGDKEYTSLCYACYYKLKGITSAADTAEGQMEETPILLEMLRSNLARLDANELCYWKAETPKRKVANA